MPHFIIDCSSTILETNSAEDLLQTVHSAAKESALFNQSIIKVRIRPYTNHLVDGEKADFIHVFGNIMEGRTIEQRAMLSRLVIKKLKSKYSDVPTISMNIFEFEKATYCNRNS